MPNPFVHNAKVVWIINGQWFPVNECHDVHYAIARQYVRKHSNDPQYAHGKLCAVSMLKNDFKVKTKRNNWIKASS